VAVASIEAILVATSGRSTGVSCGRRNETWKRASASVARVAAMPAAKFRRGGETHVHDDYPVVTPGCGTGDFEGCARPSQPTIGIAAASLAAS